MIETATQGIEPDGEEILRAIRLRMDKLRPLVEECARLEQAETAISEALGALDGSQ